MSVTPTSSMKEQKKPILLLIVISCAIPFVALCQGTMVYVSSINTPPGGFGEVAGNSWLAQGFGTGSHSSGYMVTGVQLQLTNATGNPSGLTVSIYSQNNLIPHLPGSSLGPLTGDANPLSGGIYSYSAASVVLSPNTRYYLVVTSSQPLSMGAFRWQTKATTSPVEMNGLSSGFPAESVDGTAWERRASSMFQFSVTAMTVPEPRGLTLMLTAASLTIRPHRKHGSRQAA
jgi:hypothetical protein